MAERISSLSLSQLLVLALVLHFSCALTPDGKALLEVKEGFDDTNWMLGSWNAKDPNPCGWVGVTCHFPDLRVRSINLPYMQLGGIISPSIGKLTRLHRLALHQNSLHGSIPVEIKNCTELTALYLRANYLQGSIPPELGELKHLTILDLSSNLLRGNIPPSIGQLTQLHFLNLSTNFFSGEIPNVGVLGKFRNSSFVGNPELCGLPLQKLCRGTLGFPAVLPHSEYLQTGLATQKSDVYSFGVLLLELMTGRRPTDPSFVRSGSNIVGWINTLTDDNNNKLEDILDLNCGKVAAQAVEAIFAIAAMCTDADPDERPTMFRVLQMLEQELLSPCLLSHFYQPHFSHLDI